MLKDEIEKKSIKKLESTHQTRDSDHKTRII